MANQQLHLRVFKHKKEVQLLIRKRVRVKAAQRPKNIVFKVIEQENLPQPTLLPEPNVTDAVQFRLEDLNAHLPPRLNNPAHRRPPQPPNPKIGLNRFYLQEGRL
jgi:hypothetical protein